jgi:CheY-like chemotaxis protein
MLAVTDTGTGMSEETVAKVFEPFFTTKEVGKGSGLGLSMVYGFVKQSQGHVKVYSELGQSTTIKLYLPRNARPGDKSETDATTARPIPAISRGRTILVVEDDGAVRRHTCGIVRELGFEVLEAAEAEAALSLIDREPAIALLFTDIGLPGPLNGRQLVEEARRRRPALKILYTTGYTRNAIVHNGVLDQDVELIGKPFTFEGLAAKIGQVLSQR